MTHLTAFIQEFVQKGGPEPSEYKEFDAWICEVAGELRAGRISQDDVRALCAAFGDAFSLDTMQGFGLMKPHGYAGDYEIIDRIYQQRVSADPRLRNWDLYFHTRSAPIAVRNRKAYFKDVVRSLKDHSGTPKVAVLNVGSGPARDVYEFLCEEGENGITFDCLDYDPNAIQYARSLCTPFLTSITFIQANALKFDTSKRYRLIWSAGLFDYLNDTRFMSLLRRLFGFLDGDGELVIGNFSTNNPTRDYMEAIGEWYLHHRSADELMNLAQSSGVTAANIRVDQEAEGVNLFLHVRAG